MIPGRERVRGKGGEAVRGGVERLGRLLPPLPSLSLSPPPSKPGREVKFTLPVGNDAGEGGWGGRGEEMH